MPQDDLMRRIALEALRVATGPLDGPAAEALAEAIGRQAAEAAPGEPGGPDIGRLLGEGPDALPAGLAAALARGLATARPTEGDGAAAAAERAASPFGPAPRTLHDLARTARRAAHDLNQPLTVILGYAAILKRTGTEALRAEAAEHIVEEARKMKEIIAALSRVARSLDAA